MFPEGLTERSTKFLETDFLGLLTEASSAEHDLVLSDETDSGSAVAAGSGVFTILSGVRVQLLGHIYFLICSSAQRKTFLLNNNNPPLQPK